jgi:hypothetical protein
MKNAVLSFFLMLASLFASGQTKINDITFPNTFTAGSDRLVLNGGGTREKYWMDMYVGALYLTAKSKDAASIVSSNVPMMIRVHIVSGLITSARMKEAVREGFEKSTGGKEDAYKDKIAQFESAFSEEIKKGDVFDIIYSSEAISVYKNNVLKATVPGFDFKKVVFGIWLGPDPADSDLKEGMLGELD